MSQTFRRPLVAVYGSSTLAPDSPSCREARELGRLLARAGATVMSGGYAGIMNAVSAGAREVGGEVVGVTTALFGDRAPSSHLTEQIHTADLLDRLRILTLEPDGFIVAAGNLGTLTELFLVWVLMTTSARPPAPLVLLGESWPGLIDHLRSTELVVSPDHLGLVRFARSAEEAVAQVLAPVEAAGPLRGAG